MRTHVKLFKGEKIIKKSRASYFLSEKITQRGQLFLTRERIIFRAYKFNYGQKTTAIYISDVEDLICFRRFHILPKGLGIVTKKKKIYRFSIWGRKKWRKAIFKLMKKREAEEKNIYVNNIEAIRQKLRQYKEHETSFCFNCGYEGAMGIIQKKYPFYISIPFLLFLFLSGIGILLAVFLIMFRDDHEKYIVKCPNCAHEIGPI